LGKALQRPIFDKYQILKRIAVGGMGEIFLAKQSMVKGIDRHVILKRLLPELAKEDGLLESFLDEARVAGTLNHPNIVAIYEVGFWESDCFIAMEFIDGLPLNKVFDRAQEENLPIPADVCAHIAREVATGLDYAHHATDLNGKPLRIVHRDISPHNIIVRTDSVVKLVDFGIAKAENRMQQTAAGQVKGKIFYMSPEQVSGKPIDHRTDQYALGIVLWELLTGKNLIDRGDIEALYEALNSPIPKPSRYRPDIPPDIERIVMRMLQRDAADRFRRCSHAAQALGRFLEGLGPSSGNNQIANFITQLARRRTQGLNTADFSADDLFAVLRPDDPREKTPPPSNIVEDPSGDRGTLIYRGPIPQEFAGATRTNTAILETQERTVIVHRDDEATAISPMANASDEHTVIDGKGSDDSEGPRGTVLVDDETTISDAKPEMTVKVDVSDLHGRLPDAFDPTPPPGPPVRGSAGKWIVMGLFLGALAAGGYWYKSQGTTQPTLTIKSRPVGASVRMGRTPLGKTPITMHDLVPGKAHVFWLEKRGFRSKRITVELKQSESRELFVPLRKDAQRRKR